MYYLFLLIIALSYNSFAMNRIFRNKSSKILVSESNSFEKKHDEIIQQVRTKIREDWIKKRVVCNDITQLTQLFLLDDNAFKNCGPDKQNESINIGMAFINQMMNEGLLSLGSVYDLLHHARACRDKSSQDWQYTMFDAAATKIATFLQKYATAEQIKNLIMEVHKTDNNVIGRTVPFFMCHDSARFVDLFFAVLQKEYEVLQKKEESSTDEVSQKAKKWVFDNVKSINEYLIKQMNSIQDDNQRELFFIRYADFRNRLPQEILKELPDVIDSIAEYEFIGIDQAIGERKNQEDEWDCIYDHKNRFLWLAVFDGHGGKQVADYAKSFLGKKLHQAIVKERAQHIDHAVYNVFKNINADITENKEWDRIGSTVAGIIIYKNMLYAINCGDSRVLIASNEQAEQLVDPLVVEDLTTDHIPSNKQELDRIVKPAQLDELRRKRVSRRRQEIQSPKTAHARNGSLGGVDVKFDIDEKEPLTKGDLSIWVTRSLGDLYFHPHLVGTADIKERPLATDKDCFVLIMTDGVYKNAEDRLKAPIYKSFKKNQSRDYPLAKLCAGILAEGKTPLAAAQECIKDRLAGDNATAIVLDLKKFNAKITDLKE